MTTTFYDLPLDIQNVIFDMKKTLEDNEEKRIQKKSKALEKYKSVARLVEKLKKETKMIPRKKLEEEITSEKINILQMKKNLKQFNKNKNITGPPENHKEYQFSYIRKTCCNHEKPDEIPVVCYSPVMRLKRITKHNVIFYYNRFPIYNHFITDRECFEFEGESIYLDEFKRYEVP